PGAARRIGRRQRQPRQRARRHADRHEDQRAGAPVDDARRVLDAGDTAGGRLMATDFLSSVGSVIKGAVSWPVGVFDSEPPGTPPGVPAPLAPGAWRARLIQPAWFRGVPFFVDEAGTEGGRRWQHFESPARALPFSEDLGRSIRRFALRAYT